jgi:ribosomal-protein-alanine N-acetyltransferase
MVRLLSDRAKELMADWDIPLTVRRMEVEDIPQVMAIEKASFPTPWSATSYRHELTQNEHSHYVVVHEKDAPSAAAVDGWLERWLSRLKPDAPALIGYGGFWILGEEAHISTIAVHPEWRGHGLGELLLVAMMDLALGLDAELVTLEVRVSNEVAQNLYRKYLFRKAGRRRRYYRDNDEDALIMTTPFIDDPAFVEIYHRNRAALSARLRDFAAERRHSSTSQKEKP